MPDVPEIAPEEGWPQGLRLLRGFLSPAEREALLGGVVAALPGCPFFRPRMPRWGTPFSVRMLNFGPLGWVSDKSGYRYQPHHPDTGRPWPPMPEMLPSLWRRLDLWPAPPQAALVNHYAPGARMGLHVDADEEEMDAPILSISLGCDAAFRIGGPRRGDRTTTIRLRAGDVLIMGGLARRCYHGVDRIFPGTGQLPGAIGEGRINITLRRVSRAA